MDLNTVLSFVAVASLLVISPGPNGMLIAKTVPLSGHKAGLFNVLGFLAAFYIHGTLSAFGISVLLLQSGQAFFSLKMMGAMYLIWLGIRALRNAFDYKTSSLTSPASTEKRTASLKTAFVEGFLTNLLNPKVSIFYLAAFPQFLTINSNMLDAYVLISAHAFVNFLWFAAMVFALAKVKTATNNPKFKLWLNSVTGVVFIGFGAKLALSRTS